MIIHFGTSERDGRVISIAESVRRKHVALLGKTGVGKTTLLYNMAFADLYGGVGFSVIDPHGSLVADLLGVIPRCRTNDVILLNPAADSARIMGINILESVGPNERHLVVSSVVKIIKNLWPANWGPRSEWLLEHFLYALLESPEPVTLAALPKLITDKRYRASIVAHVTDPAVLQFFDFYESQNERLREESVAPVLNKVSKFVTNRLMRAIVGQPTSSFDFRRLMDERRILLANLSKGSLGDDVSSLLGSLIVTKLSLASLSRENVAEEKRQLHVLYCDEMQNFTLGIDLPTILAESRKYALGLVVGTQTLAGLPGPTVKAIFGNCGTIASYRVSGEDAEELVREFGVSGAGARTAEQWMDLIVPASELQNLPDYKMYLRTLIDGAPRDPERVKAFPPLSPAGHGPIQRQTRRDRVTRTSLERFGRDRIEVETELNRFLSAA
jgi:Type IV secretion-system coupling protein DNA-binding domain